MKHRIIPAVAAASVVLIAGCTSQSPRSEPAASDTESCGLPEAEVQWGEFQPWPERAEIGQRRITIGADGARTDVDTPVPYRTTLLGDELHFIPWDRNELTETLLEDFERTGQSTAQVLGRPDPDFDSVAPTSPTGGTWIVGFRTTQISVPFTIDCGGEAVARGTLLTTEDNDTYGSIVHCGESSIDDDYVTELSKLCPPA